MTARRIAAAVLVCVALALAAIAVAPPARVHRALDARAGHVVTDGYVDHVRTRGAVCAALTFLIAIAAAFAPMRARVPASPRAAFEFSNVALLLLAMAAATRGALLTGPPHYDEAFTVTEFASKSPLFFLSRYTHANNHVFHTLLVWGVHLVAGNRLWALRLPAFLCGVAVVAATYLVARRVANEWTAILAMALAAVATPLVEYSAQARGYTILTLAFLLLYLLDDDRVRIVLIALAAWTIPTALYAAAAWAVWMLITTRDAKRIAIVAAAAGALTFLLYLPILLISGPDSITANGNVLSVSYPVLAHALPRSFIEMARDWSLSFTIPLAIVIGIAVLIAIARRTAAGVLLGSAIVAIVPLLIAMRKVPFPRVWIFLLPIVLIAAASELARLPRSTPAIVILTLLLALNALRVTRRDDFVEDPALRDMQPIVALLRQLPPFVRVLVTSPLDAPFRLYAGDRILEDRFDSDPAVVRAAVAASPRTYFLASTRPGGMAMFEALHLPHTPIPVTRFPHAALFELRSRL